jgi:hypothetical protein
MGKTATAETKTTRTRAKKLPVEQIDQATSITGEQFAALVDGDRNQATYEATVEQMSSEDARKARREAIVTRNAAIVEMVLGGATYGAAAEHFKVSSSLVHEVMIQAGWKKPTDPKHAERDAAIFAAYDEGKGQATIADEFGLSENRVRLILAGRLCQPLPAESRPKRTAAARSLKAKVEAVLAELEDEAPWPTGIGS